MDDGDSTDNRTVCKNVQTVRNPLYNGTLRYYTACLRDKRRRYAFLRFSRLLS